MHPVLFDVAALLEPLMGAGAGRPIGSWGLCLSLAVLVGGGLGLRAAQRAGLDVALVAAAMAVALGAGLLGAYALFVLVGVLGGQAFWDVLARGGFVFLGGLFGGGLGLGVACWRFSVPLGLLLDVAVPGLAAAHAVGRMGCFLGGCCFGRAWDGPWAVTYTSALAPAAVEHVGRHPTPLYEAALLLVLALAFALRPPDRVGRGLRMAAYLALYSVARCGLEFFRGDVIRGLYLHGWVSTSQILGLTLLLGCLGWWVGDWLTRGSRVGRRAS